MKTLGDDKEGRNTLAIFRISRGGGVLPIMIYKEKLRPKEVPSLYKMKYKKVRTSGLSLPVYNFFQYLPPPPHHIEDNSFSTMIGILYQSL